MDLRKAPIEARNAAQSLVDLVLPHRCLRCGVVVSRPGGLCGDCWPKMTFLTGFDLCRRCGVPMVSPSYDGRCHPCASHPPIFDGAVAPLLYDDASRPLVLAMKHGDRLDLAPPLASMMMQVAGEVLAQADGLVAVPIHRRRLLQRRFNQAAELARLLGKQSGVPVLPALSRVKRTPSQSGGRASRRANVRDAFAVVQGGGLTGKTLILVDDVLTTGSTAEECTKVLKMAGASRVYVLTLARAPLPDEGTQALGLIDWPV